MFLCEALWACLVYEKCYINKVALPYLNWYRRTLPSGAQGSWPQGLLPVGFPGPACTGPAYVWWPPCNAAAGSRRSPGNSWRSWGKRWNVNIGTTQKNVYPITATDLEQSIVPRLFEPDMNTWINLSTLGAGWLVTWRLLVWFPTPASWVWRCPWARRLTLTATDQLAVALRGRLRAYLLIACLYVLALKNSSQRCVASYPSYLLYTGLGLT